MNNQLELASTGRAMITKLKFLAKSLMEWLICLPLATIVNLVELYFLYCFIWCLRDPWLLLWLQVLGPSAIGLTNVFFLTKIAGNSRLVLAKSFAIASVSWLLFGVLFLLEPGIGSLAIAVRCCLVPGAILQIIGAIVISRQLEGNKRNQLAQTVPTSEIDKTS